LGSWAVWEIYKATKDVSFIEEMLPKLQRYHQWWYRNRDHNQNGLVEYGATKHRYHNDVEGNISFKVRYLTQPNNSEPNTPAVDLKTCKSADENWYICSGISLYQNIIARSDYDELDIGAQHGTAWESGMDNAARFGFINAEQLSDFADKHYQGDLTKARKDWQVMFYQNTNNAGDLLGFSINQESVELNTYLAHEKTLLANMAELLQQEKLAASYRQATKGLSKRINQCFFDEDSGFFYDRSFTLSTLKSNIKGVQESEQVDKNGCIGTLLTARGRVWLDQVYFGLIALDNYGYHQEAKTLAEKLFNNA
jgi:putative isomerase